MTMETLLNLLHQAFSNFAPFVILLGFLIFVHELGHFLVAKWSGVRVEVFSLGFGKKLFTYKYRGTNYCISMIPLGGYVKMFGDEIGAEIEASEKRYSFTHKPIWKRIAIVLAGPLMNFFFAILIFSVVASIGEEVRTPTIGDVNQKSTAYKEGFRSGDEVLKVNGESITSWDSLQDILTKNANHELKFDVRRDSTKQIVHVEAAPKLIANQNVLSLDDYVGDIDGLSNTSRSTMIGIIYNSPAQTFGLHTGDRIVSINNEPTLLFRNLGFLFRSHQDQNVELEIERIDGKDSKTLKLKGHLDKFSSLASFGIEPPDLYLSTIVEGSPAFAAGLQSGDKVLSVGSVKSANWDDILNTVKSFSGSGTLSVVISRKGEEKKFEITPKMTEHKTPQYAEEKRYTLGIIPWIQNAPTPTITIATANIGTAFLRGLKKTKDVTTMTVVSFLRLVQLRISPKNIGGVIAIGQAASQTFKDGISHFLQLMGFLSINLFILNLLPIPVLDGGHLLFYCIEALRGTPLSMRKMEIAQQIGLLVLMSLMALSLFNDFSRVFDF